MYIWVGSESNFLKREVERSQKFFVLFYSLVVLALESSRVKVCFVWCWGTAPVKEMVKKRADYGHDSG